MSKKDKKEEKNIDPSAQVLSIFLLVSVVFFVLKFVILRDNKGTQAMVGVFALYLIIVGITAIVLNNRAIKNKCGEENFGMAFLATLVPWGLIFGLLNLVLIIFPGWKAPFSNTFGYLIVKLSGLNDILNNTLKTKAGKSEERGVNEMITKIYTDRSLLINEITPDNYQEFWDSMRKGNLLTSKANDFKDKLRELIIMKDIVSEFIWYILTGIIITTLSSNYISSVKCVPSSEYLEKKHKEWETKGKQIKREGKIYYETD